MQFPVIYKTTTLDEKSFIKRAYWEKKSAAYLRNVALRIERLIEKTNKRFDLKPLGKSYESLLIDLDIVLSVLHEKQGGYCNEL